MKKETPCKITSIGGSALIEGIMMRGPKKTTVAVRVGEEEIYTENLDAKTLGEKYKFFKTPFIRGFASLIDSMKLSYKSLMISANKALEAGEIEEEEPGRFEKWLTEKFGDKLMSVLMVFSTIIGFALAIFLFFFLPTFLYDLIAFEGSVLYGNVFFKSVFEGILKIALFLGYIVLVARMNEMKRVFMYHGAEHKTIACYEAGEELTPENIKKHTRFHPRCGTSFLVYMLILGILIGLFIPYFPGAFSWLRPAIKILILPITCGIGYELLRLCGKFNNAVTRALSTPGIWAQHITTKEPDEKMLEVAIAAMTSVIPEDGTDIVSK